MILSSSNRKYQPCPLLSYFSVVVGLSCLLLFDHILSLIAYKFRENRDFVFIIIVQFMMRANIRTRFGLQIVCKIKQVFPVIHYTIYGAVCFQFTHFPCDDWENIHFGLLSSSNRKYELLSIVWGYVMKQWYALYVSLYSWNKRYFSSAMKEFFYLPQRRVGNW